MSTDTTELIAEGLRLPIVKLFEQGTRNEAVFDIISTNSRLPEFVQGDLWAQISAGRRAAEIIRQLCRRYGTKTVYESIANAKVIGQKRAYAGLATLPVGRYRISEPQDDGSIWPACITITPEQFIVDLREAPTEVPGPYAHAYYFETRMKLIDMLWHCLAQSLPDRLPAGHFASIFGTVISGKHPDSGRRYAMVEPQMGGWGATTTRPGQSAMFSTNHGDTFNCPVEIAEARYDYAMKQYCQPDTLTRKYQCGRTKAHIKVVVTSLLCTTKTDREKLIIWLAGYN